MPNSLRIVVVQRPFCVGDVSGNADAIIADAARARTEHAADVVVFPELALVGYPPDDLLLRTGLPDAVRDAQARIAASVPGEVTVVYGHPSYEEGVCRNSASVVQGGVQCATTHKQALPNYGVFDEKRHFSAGDRSLCFDCKGVRIGLLVCEDLWVPEPSAQALADGAELLISINASPYTRGKAQQRAEIIRSRGRETRLPIVYANLVGGQDDLLFDGASQAIDAHGNSCFVAPSFADGLYTLHFSEGQLQGPICEGEESLGVLYQGLVRAVRDYVDRNGFPGAIVGLSGGIDSALVAALASDALGPERVRTVAMPSRYTADMSNDDAAEQARRLGTRHSVIPVEPAFTAYSDMLAESFAGRTADVTEENLQSRIRGTLLMALSNKFGNVVLTTGNKSEMAVGYATLYGDMCGGFAPLKDVYKGDVWRLARWRNREQEVIPQRVIDRPPSAELRADQTDEDSLPPYSVLDEVLRLYVEEQCAAADIVARGFDPEVVEQITALVRRAEYKRRQAPPGPKVTPVAFGRDRRFPITARYDAL
ncbi:NAD+ synthase [Algiphilus sp.]|uniref:NAD+ synthase n=1 Tax=Algiphilus sp. TaxID=1872431 RepID=UPI003B5195B6